MSSFMCLTSLGWNPQRAFKYFVHGLHGQFEELREERRKKNSRPPAGYKGRVGKNIGREPRITVSHLCFFCRFSDAVVDVVSALSRELSLELVLMLRYVVFAY